MGRIITWLELSVNHFDPDENANILGSMMYTITNQLSALSEAAAQ